MKYLYIYRNISVPANAITLLSCYVYWQFNSISTLSILFWTKVITTITLIFYIFLFKNNILVFFMNLGIGSMKFYSSMFVIDMIIFVILISTTVVLA